MEKKDEQWDTWSDPNFFPHLFLCHQPSIELRILMSPFFMVLLFKTFLSYPSAFIGATIMAHNTDNYYLISVWWLSIPWAQGGLHITDIHTRKERDIAIGVHWEETQDLERAKLCSAHRYFLSYSEDLEDWGWHPITGHQFMSCPCGPTRFF